MTVIAASKFTGRLNPNEWELGVFTAATDLLVSYLTANSEYGPIAELFVLTGD